MPRGSHLGEFEYLVMLALVRLDADAYGMRVRREIESRARRDVAIGSVYATLDRLERKGLAESSARIDESGRARKYFRVTEPGDEAMQRHLDAIVRMGEGLALHEKLDAL